VLLDEADGSPRRMATPRSVVSLTRSGVDTSWWVSGVGGMRPMGSPRASTAPARGPVAIAPMAALTTGVCAHVSACARKWSELSSPGLLITEEGREAMPSMVRLFRSMSILEYAFQSGKRRSSARRARTTGHVVEVVRRLVVGQGCEIGPGRFEPIEMRSDGIAPQGHGPCDQQVGDGEHAHKAVERAWSLARHRERVC
jgi:hypothetical protein